MGEAEIEAMSFKSPTSKSQVKHLMLLAHKRLVFPYPKQQLIWLRDSLQILKARGEQKFRCRGSTQERSDQALNACIAGFYGHGTLEAPPDLCASSEYTDASSDGFERFAVPVSFLTRKISMGQLVLNAPPYDVPLCPDHYKSIICSCLYPATSLYKPFSCCPLMKLHEQRPKMYDPYFYLDGVRQPITSVNPPCKL